MIIKNNLKFYYNTIKLNQNYFFYSNNIYPMLLENESFIPNLCEKESSHPEIFIPLPKESKKNSNTRKLDKDKDKDKDRSLSKSKTKNIKNNVDKTK